MRRRKVLVLSTAFIAGLSGCSDSGTQEIEDPQETASPTPEDTDTPKDTDTPEDTDAETDSPTEETGEPNVVLGDRQLVKDDSGFDTEAYAEVIVENDGDRATGQVEINVEWYDADGNFLGNDTGYLPSLDAGETWIAQITAISAEPENIDSIEVTGNFETESPTPPEGMSVSESELQTGEFEANITGLATNNREEAMDYIEAHGKIYDDAGNVIGGGWTNEDDIPAGRDWRFEIMLTGRAEARAGDAADHVAYLDATGI